MGVSPERFSESSRRLVQARDTQLILSAASAWEIAIKCSLGKLRLPVPARDFVPGRLRLLRTSSLPITHDHALRTGELPYLHRDPFDRILIAQAQLERLSILTADRQFAAYDVEVIWA